MKIVKRSLAFLLPFGITGAILAADSTDETPEALNQKLQTLKQENKELEIDNLKTQITQEEKRNAELKKGETPKEESAPSADPEKSQWVKERDRFEDQVDDKVEKLKNLF